MKIDFTTVLLDLKGEAIKEREFFGINPNFIDSEKTPTEEPRFKRLIDMTLSTVCVNALHTTLPGDEKMTGVQKNTLFLLSLKIMDNDHAELRVEDLNEIKERVAKMYNVLVVGRAFQLLDPE